MRSSTLTKILMRTLTKPQHSTTILRGREGKILLGVISVLILLGISFFLLFHGHCYRLIEGPCQDLHISVVDCPTNRGFREDFHALVPCTRSKGFTSYKLKPDEFKPEKKKSGKKTVYDAFGTSLAGVLTS
jgi:hypothetical protein